MSSIPEDVYLDILARLPVKSLLRCKNVCKSWFQIISNPNFVKMHCNFTIQENNPSLMFNKYDTKRGCYDIHIIGYDSISWPKRCYEFDESVKRDFPLETRYSKFHGCCNGLVYFWNYGRKLFCIWNPATKVYKILPKLSVIYTKGYIKTRGFGYDCKNDDYKVINVVNIDGRYLLDVYTLGTNSWKSKETEIYIISSNNGVLVNGALHWSGLKRGKKSKVIISLDISDEKYKELEPPKEGSGNKNLWMNLGVLEGLLCVLDVVYKGQLEVWVMQDYGVQESWTKRYTITNEKIMRSYWYSSVKLIWSFKNGEILFSNIKLGKLVLYDPKQRSAKEFCTYIADIESVVGYFESLFSVNSGTYVDGNQEDKEEDSDKSLM